MRSETRQAAEGWRLALPGRPLGGRIGERLGRGTGTSLEFMDFRDYVPGDDLRHIDWSAYARTDQLKVRLYREEIAPTLDIVVDLSPSMAVTPAKAQAVEDIVEAAALWTRQAGGIPRRLRADAGEFRTWDEVAFDGSDDWNPHVPLRRGAMVLIVSDLLWPEDPRPRVRRLAGGATHCYLVQVLDPWEVEPSAQGGRTLLDCETRERVDIVLDAGVVAGYRKRLERLCDAARDAVREIAGSYARVQADAPAPMFREQLMPQGIVEPA